MPSRMPYVEPRWTVHETWVPRYVIRIESVPIPIEEERYINLYTGQEERRPNRWAWYRRTIPIRCLDSITFDPPPDPPRLLPHGSWPTRLWGPTIPGYMPPEDDFFWEWAYEYPTVPWPGCVQWFLERPCLERVFVNAIAALGQQQNGEASAPQPQEGNAGNNMSGVPAHGQASSHQHPDPTSSSPAGPPQPAEPSSSAGPSGSPELKRKRLSRKQRARAAAAAEKAASGQSSHPVNASGSVNASHSSLSPPPVQATLSLEVPEFIPSSRSASSSRPAPAAPSPSASEAASSSQCPALSRPRAPSQTAPAPQLTPVSTSGSDTEDAAPSPSALPSRSAPRPQTASARRAVSPSQRVALPRNFPQRPVQRPAQRPAPAPQARSASQPGSGPPAAPPPKPSDLPSAEQKDPPAKDKRGN